MQSARSVGHGMLAFFLLVSANARALPGFSGASGFNLNCLSDGIEFMSCEFEAQQCPQYNVTLRNRHDGAGCIFKQCGDGRCCCSTKITLVPGETFVATVSRGGDIMASKNISVTDSFKPRVPEIVSVNESNGNFVVMWKSNMESQETLDDSLTSTVTYYKKGDPKKRASETFKPTIVDGLKYYEISDRLLEPSTTYMVSVKSYLEWSNRFSDPSEEKEFTTPMSLDTLLVVIIVSLSIGAVIIIGAMYCCYAKFKAMWWDKMLKCPNPKLPDMHPNEQKILKPMVPSISSVCVEHLIQDDDKPWSKGCLRDPNDGSFESSSEVNSGSTCLSYANTGPDDIRAGGPEDLGNIFANISPISLLNTSPALELNRDSGVFSSPFNLWGTKANDTSSASSGIDNKTYSLLIPSFPPQIIANSPALQIQADILCDPTYHASEGNTVISAQQLLPAPLLLPAAPAGSSLMLTDMSYHQCNTDPHAEASSGSSSSSGADAAASGDPVPSVEAGHDDSDEVAQLNAETEMAIVCDENPCYGTLPAGPCSFPLVEDEYQAFQSLVEQPDILCSEKWSGKDLEHFSKHPEESFTLMHRGFSSPVVLTSVPFTQKPFLPLFSVAQDTAVITDSGYQSL